jgi:oxygen-independent coproporphyrinogen-3 oxidase
MNTLSFDASLLRRYDRAGPRYTSYPAATHFTSSFTAAMLREYIRRGNEELIPRNLSLYVHIPYCFSPCFYCGCNRIITRNPAKGRRYLDRLVREIALVGELFHRDRDVMQLHFGGGTPNFLQPHEIQELVDSLARHFHFSASPRRDFSIELDPRFVQAGDIACYAALGLNRASLGVQDFDPAVQRAVNRVQSVEQTLAVIDECRAHAFRSINVDLIYGLPKQTAAGFSRTLDTIVDVRPDRLAVYSYAHMPHMFKAQRQINESDLPSAQEKLGLLQLAIEKLSAAGYVYIGMDHFALPEDDLARAQAAHSLHRNFMGYTTHAACDLVGLGVSAISHIGDSFTQNPRDLAPWERALDLGHLPIWRGRHLDADDLARGDAIQQLMCQGSIDTAGLEERYNLDFQSYFQDALARLEQLAADGLVALRPGRIDVTSQGRLLLRIIAMCFDRYLNDTPLPASATRFSRVI